MPLFLRALTLFSCLFNPFAGATSFISMPFPNRVQETPIVVRGIAESSHTEWAQVGGESRRIHTYTEIRVEEILRGHPKMEGHVLMVRTLGGEKDGLVMEVPGTPKFEAGQEVVLFLREPNSDESYDVASLMMGKLEVRRNRDGKATLSGPALFEGQGVMGHSGTSPEKNLRTDWSLNDLKELIRRQNDARGNSQSPENSSEAETAPQQSPTASPLQTQTVRTKRSPPPGVLSQSPGDDAEVKRGSAESRFLWIGVILGLGLLGALLWFMGKR